MHVHVDQTSHGYATIAINDPYRAGPFGFLSRSNSSNSTIFYKDRHIAIEPRILFIDVKYLHVLDEN